MAMVMSCHGETAERRWSCESSEVKDSPSPQVRKVANGVEGSVCSTLKGNVVPWDDRGVVSRRR